MKNEIIKNKWINFIDKNKIYFKSDIEIWMENKQKLQDYFDTYKERPDKKDSMNIWICVQQRNFKQNKKNMKITEIKESWINFKKTNKKFFK